VPAAALNQRLSRMPFALAVTALLRGAGVIVNAVPTAAVHPDPDPDPTLTLTLTLILILTRIQTPTRCRTQTLTKTLI